jgi:hypothetical protein
LGFIGFQKRLIALGLILVPFISFGELLALFSGSLSSQVDNLSGPIKFLKDIIFGFLILFGLTIFFVKDRLNRNFLLYFSILLMVVVPAIVMSLNDFVLTASGIRWLIPLILPFFIYEAVDDGLKEILSKWLFRLLLLHLIVQIFQMFFASAWYGVSSFGLSLRNPGLFLIPNTGAFFTIMCLYFLIFLSEISDLKRIVIFIVSIFSVFLTLSGTGLIVLITVLFFYFANSRMVKWMLIVFPVMLIFFGLFLNFLNQRDENYVEASGGGRLSIFLESFEKAGLVSGNFGLGTNTAVLLGKGEIMDSTYASLVVNLGYLGFFILLACLFLLTLFALVIKDRALVLFLVILILFGLTTIISEVYPVNLICAVISVIFFNKHGFPKSLTSNSEAT